MVSYGWVAVDSWSSGLFSHQAYSTEFCTSQLARCGRKDETIRQVKNFQFLICTKQYPECSELTAASEQRALRLLEALGALAFKLRDAVATALAAG